MMSPASIGSFWVDLERDAFIGQMSLDRSRTMLPIKILPCVVPSISNAFAWIDGTTQSFDDTIDEILQAIARLYDFTPRPRSILPPPQPVIAPAPAPVTPPSSAPTPIRTYPPAPSDPSRRRLITGALAGLATLATAGGIAAVIAEHGRGSSQASGATPSPTSSPSQTPGLGTPRANIVPASLASLGFTGWSNNGTTFILPPVVTVAAGAFMMGSASSDTQAYSNEYLHQVTLAAYEIGVYHLTVAEFALAVQAKAPGVDTSSDWATQQQRLDHPVVSVSWLNILAYTQWLAQVSGQLWRMPGEAEWEKAARWDVQAQHARIYPWGDTWDKTRANTYDGGPGDTTAVGAYASKGDASPYGCHDMAGNAWQWCSSIYRDDAYQIDSSHENNGDITSGRVQRGGSWYYVPRLARAAYPGPQHPGLRRRSPGSRAASYLLPRPVNRHMPPAMTGAADKIDERGSALAEVRHLASRRGDGQRNTKEGASRFIILRGASPQDRLGRAAFMHHLIIQDAHQIFERFPLLFGIFLFPGIQESDDRLITILS